MKFPQILCLCTSIFEFFKICLFSILLTNRGAHMVSETIKLCPSHGADSHFVTEDHAKTSEILYFQRLYRPCSSKEGIYETADF